MIEEGSEAGVRSSVEVPHDRKGERGWRLVKWKAATWPKMVRR